jgi:hypothetical protein
MFGFFFSNKLPKKFPRSIWYKYKHV